MAKTAVVTDSNSGITKKQADELGVFVLPMPFYIDNVLYFEEISLFQEQFYTRLKNNSNITTSQPSVGDLKELLDSVLKDYDEIVHIPMSSALSSSMASAMALSREYDSKVQVVDNLKISVPLRQSVLDALNLVNMGFDAKQIKSKLESSKMDTSIFIMVDTLKYLKKGGRITPATAAVGTLLNIKPILKIKGNKPLDACAKARGIKQAVQVMLKAVDREIESDYKDEFDNKQIHFYVAHTQNDIAAKQFAEQIRQRYNWKDDIYIDKLSLSVACHVGPGALAMAISKKLI